MAGLAFVVLAACFIFDFNPWEAIVEWRHCRLAARVRELEAERKAHVAALKIYAAPKNWIGDAFVEKDDPAAAARIALDVGDKLSAIKALPASRFATKKARRA